MVENEKSPKRRRTPPKTPVEYENRLISLAMKQAERQLADGTAPAAVVTHYLKLGTVREEIERDKLRQETELARAKVEALEREERTQEMFDEAIKAMSRYKGSASGD